MSHDSHVTIMAEIVTWFSELVRHRISTRESHLNVTSHILLRHIDVKLCHIIIYTAHKRATKSKNTNTSRLMATEFKLTNFQKHTAAAATTTITVEWLPSYGLSGLRATLPAASPRLPKIIETDAPHRGYKTSWLRSIDRRSPNLYNYTEHAGRVVAKSANLFT